MQLQIGAISFLPLTQILLEFTSNIICVKANLIWEGLFRRNSGGVIDSSDRESQLTFLKTLKLYFCRFE